MPLPVPVSEPFPGGKDLRIVLENKTIHVLPYSKLVFFDHWVQVNYKEKAHWFPAEKIIYIYEPTRIPTDPKWLESETNEPA
jgi:hypothetical protein